MSTLASHISPIPLPSPTVVCDGWTINLRGTICIQQGKPLPMPVSWRFEYLAEDTIDPGVGFPEWSRAIVLFYPKCPFYYSAVFIVTFIPGWVTVSQPTGFDGLERAYEPADPAVFPPGAKQSSPPPISSPIPLQDPRMVDGWQVMSHSIISHKSQSFPEGNTTCHEQEFITVPHWSLSPQEMATEAMDGGDEEATDRDDAPPPGTVISTSVVWIMQGNAEAELCSEKCVERNRKKTDPGIKI
ncbi:hypothetical protein BS47DRAFT_1369625 [Hydnum rufescens UP504]|uniref:Uncharacterized protein n=1 Tax=Hydnum rufescens UP504 TaxID=1448309 RepID=A0A9P6AC92_9AGAM|nr:hypothetical protein BS47DRAFT_1369625 [Hydnum rufescens UP504]